MIQYINNKVFLLLFVLFSFIRCKDYNNSKELSTTHSINNYSTSNQKNILVESIGSLKEITKKNKKIKNWIFFKVVPLSNNYDCSTEIYKNFKFSISNDSVFIDNIYTDDVYRGIIKSSKYFSQKYLYNLYKDFIPKNFNVALPDEIDNIRNKNVYSKKSKLDKYFEDAFFINDYMFFEKNGCLYCFLKESPTINKIKLPINKSKLLDPNYSIAPLETNLVINDSKADGEYKINEKISILWFDGDSEKWYLILLNNNKIIDKLLIGKSETIYLVNGESEDTFIDFFIEKDLKIKLEFSRGKGYNLRKKYKEEFYNVIDNKIVKK